MPQMAARQKAAPLDDVSGLAASEGLAEESLRFYGAQKVMLSAPVSTPHPQRQKP